MLWVHYSSGESRYPTYVYTVSLQPLNFSQSKMSEHTKSGSASEIDVNELGKNKSLKEINERVTNKAISPKPVGCEFSFYYRNNIIYVLTALWNIFDVIKLYTILTDESEKYKSSDLSPFIFPALPRPSHEATWLGRVGEDLPRCFFE